MRFIQIYKYIIVLFITEVDYSQCLSYNYKYITVPFITELQYSYSVRFITEGLRVAAGADDQSSWV